MTSSYAGPQWDLKLVWLTWNSVDKFHAQFTSHKAVHTQVQSLEDHSSCAALCVVEYELVQIKDFWAVSETDQKQKNWHDERCVYVCVCTNVRVCSSSQVKRSSNHKKFSINSMENRFCFYFLRRNATSDCHQPVATCGSDEVSVVRCRFLDTHTHLWTLSNSFLSDICLFTQLDALSRKMADTVHEPDNTFAAN